MATPRDKKKRKTSGDDAVASSSSPAAAKVAKSACSGGSDPTTITITSSSSSSSSSSPPAADVTAAFAFEKVEARARIVTAALSREIDTEKVFKGAKVHYLTSDRASWVYQVPRWYRHVFSALSRSSEVSLSPPVPSDDDNSSSIDIVNEQAPLQPVSYFQWLDQVWDLHPQHHDSIKMFGRDVPTPRYQQAYAVSYRFSGNTFEAQPVPETLQHCVATMQAMVMNSETHASFLRGVLVNWYANGEHYIGPHSDSESSLFKHSPVFSLSLGATRRFIFTAKSQSGDKKSEAVEPAQRLELELGDGDLVVMGGTTQQTHKHALPKMKKCFGKRVSVTLRCFK